MVIIGITAFFKDILTGLTFNLYVIVYHSSSIFITDIMDDTLMDVTNIPSVLMAEDFHTKSHESNHFNIINDKRQAAMLNLDPKITIRVDKDNIVKDLLEIYTDDTLVNKDLRVDFNFFSPDEIVAGDGVTR